MLRVVTFRIMLHVILSAPLSARLALQASKAIPLTFHLSPPSFPHFFFLWPSSIAQRHSVGALGLQWWCVGADTLDWCLGTTYMLCLGRLAPLPSRSLMATTWKRDKYKHSSKELDPHEPQIRLSRRLKRKWFTQNKIYQMGIRNNRESNKLLNWTQIR